jgi:hypothetical protein
MMKGEFIHHPHGEEYHNIAIMITKSICSKRGYTFLDPRPFKDKGIYPGDPDVCVRVNNKTGFMNYVLEIETNPTKASVTKKKTQFQADGVTDLIIIDMRILSRKRDWKVVKLGELIAFLDGMIP